MPDFSERIKHLRVQSKVLQKDIADYLGITIRAYQYYESGNKYPDFKGLLALADYFDVSLDYLVGRTNNPNVKKDDEFHI